MVLKTGVRLGLAAVAALAGLHAAAIGGAANPENSIVSIRRLTADQYRQTISDVFGSDISISGRFEPDLRRGGLLAVGASAVTVTPAGAEQYDVMARGIAAQVVSAPRRDALLSCKPRDPAKADAKCAAQIIGAWGRHLYRRPLSADELEAEVGLAGASADRFKDFHAGLEASLSGMLVSPEFLFVIERQERHGDGPPTLDAFSKAQRLSFLLWNSTPDGELLRAAGAGDLDTMAGLRRQVDRLINSPRFERGVRAFFDDWYALGAFDDLAKDAAIYPKFNAAVGLDAREQTLRFLVDHLVRRNESYQGLFTTPRTFMNRTLGAIYRAPVSAKAGWEPYEFSERDGRVGLLGQLSFLTLHSHPGRSSPTLRGKAIREILLCQEVPAPPANVDFVQVQDTSNPNFKTARQRLARHATDPTCSGCHRVTDPLGLALENFDSVGEQRATENGALIDASGEYNGEAIGGAADLGRALAKDPQITSCLVSRLYAYGVGREIEGEEQVVIEALERSSAKGAYRDLVRAIVTSEDFYRPPPKGALHASLKTSSSRER